jgi:hypothetical protein
MTFLWSWSDALSWLKGGMALILKIERQTTGRVLCVKNLVIQTVLGLPSWFGREET